MSHERWQRCRCQRRCLSQGRPRAASRRWRWRWPRSSAASIVNADSMQVYRDLRVITARPTPAEEARVPHRLYGHVDAAENYSVGRWCRDVGEALAEIAARRPRADPGRRHRALFQGADRGPGGGAADPGRDPRASARRGCRAKASRALHAELSRAIPSTAQRLMPNDRARICARAGGGAGDRPLARRLAPRGHAAAGRSGARGQGLPHLRARGARARASRRALPRCSTAGALDEVRRAGRARARSAAAGDEGARRALADPPSQRRDLARRGGGRRASWTPAATPSGRSPGSAIR